MYELREGEPQCDITLSLTRFYSLLFVLKLYLNKSLCLTNLFLYLLLL